MKVILLEDVKKVGVRGALVTVADGYAQNVLIPKKLGVLATPQNIAKWEKDQAGKKERQASDAASAAELVAKLDGKTVEVKARANPSGGLFEAVREKQIMDAIGNQLGISLTEGALSLSEAIKKLGPYRVKVSLHGVSGELTVLVSGL
ncbi:MAG: 50S ribosomal protein L9 [Patescibacteria group bacterium]|nr:50S ribosomal protein L9 [Patescibacteria group bacterium]